MKNIHIINYQNLGLLFLTLFFLNCSNKKEGKTKQTISIDKEMQV